MSDARWNRLWKLFRQALEKAPAERAGWLERQCDDPTMREEVARLLEAHGRTSTPLDRPPGPLLEIAPGIHFGPWRVVERLGCGGMGEVYRVARDDDTFERPGALKLLAPWHSSPALGSRLQHEQRILAGLDHPFIARLLDAGSTEDGHPWLVMELVEGEPITDYCRRLGLSTPERLVLFEQICEAVQHAHRKLVVHRDLKPANILIRDDGQPALLDFGIAKLLDAAQDPGLTRAEDPLPLTPHYASPEQVRRQTTGVAMDIYSLGVMLYQLLADSPPFTAALDSTEAWLDERRAGPPPLDERQPVELNWIIQRALQFEPDERYRSVEALAADVSAVRHHQPPRARAVGAAYRLRKFARRNWRGLGAAAGVLAVVLGLAAGLVHENRMAYQARADSLQAQQRAERVSDFLVSLFEMADATRNAGVSLEAGELLQRGREQLRNRPDLDPDDRVSFLLVLSDVHANLGEYPTALALASEAGELSRRRGDSLNELRALQRLGSVHHLAGHPKRARGTLERAFTMLRHVDDPSLEMQVTLHHGLGRVLQGQGELEAAGDHFRRAADRLAAAAQPDPALQAESALRLGSWHWLAGRLDEAERHYARARDFHRDDTPAPTPELATATDAHAAALYALGRLEEAAGEFGRAVTIRRRVLGASHPETADSLSHLGAVLYDLGRPAAAEPALREALAIYGRSVGGDSPVQSGAWNNLGLVLRARDRHEAAQAAFERALTLNRSAYGPVHQNNANNLNNLGLLAEDRHEWEQALTHYRDSDGILREIKGADHPDRGFPLTNQGRVQLLREQPAAAAALFQEAWELRAGKLGEDHPQVADTLFWWGLGECAFDQRESGLSRLQQARTIRHRVFGPDSEAGRTSTLALEACRRPERITRPLEIGAPGEPESLLVERLAGAR